MQRSILLRIQSALQQHWLALAVAACFATLMILPVALLPAVLPPGTYQGITIANHGLDELWYLSRGREVLDGHPLGNAVLREGKDLQDPYFTFVEKALVSPIKWLGLAKIFALPTWYAIYNFLGVFLLFLLIYFFVRQVSSHSRLSVLAASLVIGGYAILQPDSLFSINIYSRDLSPYLPLLLVMAYANTTLKMVRLPSWNRSWLNIILFAALFYAYFYAWSFVLTVNGALILLAIWHREKKLAQIISVVTAAGLLLGLGNLLSLYNATHGELNHALQFFHWVENTHRPFVGLTNILITLVWFAYSRQKKDPHQLFFEAVILAAWLVTNQQILTGHLLQAGHFNHFIQPFALIIIIYCLWQSTDNEKVKTCIWYGCIGFTLLNTSIGQYRALLNQLEIKESYQNYKPLINVLNQESPGVILAADNRPQYLFTIFTPHDLFWARNYLVVNVPVEERLRDTLFIYFYLNKDSRTHFTSYLQKQLQAGDSAFYGSPTWFYGSIFMTLEGYTSGLPLHDYEYLTALQTLPPDQAARRVALITALDREYAKVVSQPDGVVQLLKKYKVAYLVWDKTSNPEWDLSVLRDKEVVIARDNLVLYRLK